MIEIMEMNMHKFTFIGCVVFVATLATTPSVAETIYTLDVGLVHSNVDTHLGNFTSQPTTTIKDDFSGVGGYIGIGVSFTANHAVEGRWIRFGDSTATASYEPVCAGGGCPPTISEVRQSGSAFWVAYTPMFHRDDWSYHGKIGVARTIIETKSSTLGERAENLATAPLVGAGVVYHFRDNLGLRFDLDWMGGKATTFGLGINYRF
jgi:hypothetical protein